MSNDQSTSNLATLMTSCAHPVDMGIFAVFLVVTLVVGLGYGRQVSTIRDYSLGGKNFSTSTLVATIVATWFGGGFLFYDLANIYSTGLYFIIATLGSPLCLLITGQFLALRMGAFLKNLSVAEAMGDLYGKVVRTVTAVSGILKSIGGVAIQFQVIGKMITFMLGIEGPEVTVIAATIVIGYSAFGGIRAVTFTDVVQFFTFGTVIPILALIIWNNIKDHNQVVETLTTNPIFDLKEVVGWNTKFISAIALMLYFAIPGMSAPGFQRISMARDVRQVKQSFTYASLIALLITAFVAWVAILLLANNPALEASKLVNYIINQYAHPGFRGLVAIGIMALAMSTADSYLNSSAVLFANDFAEPLGLTTIKSILTARVFSITLGVLALLLALYETDLLSLVLLSGNFYMPIVTVPLLMAILGFRSSPRAVLIGMLAGFTTVVLWRNFLAYTGIDSVIPGTLASLIFLLGSHYLLGEPGGWQQVAPDSPLGLERTARRKAWKKRLEAIKSFKLYAYLQQNLPTQEGFYSLFGFYAIAATYTAFYTIGGSEVKAYQDIYEGIYHTVLFATTAFLTFPIWPPTVKSQHFITFFWPIGMGAILFFAGTLLAIMSQFHPMQVMVLMINLLVAILLLRWPLALLLAFLGIASAIVFFKQYTGTAFPTNGLGSLQFRTIYGLMFFASFLIALFKGKHAYRQLETHNANLVTTNQDTANELLASVRDGAHFVQAFRKAEVPKLTELTGLSRKVEEGLKGSNMPQSVISGAHALHEQLSSMTVQLDRLDHRAVGYLRLEIGTIALDDLLEAVDHKLQAKGIAQNVTFNKATQHATLQCDIARIKTLLVKAVSFLRMTLGAEACIVLHIEDTQLGYLLPSAKENYTKKIEALRFTLTPEPDLPKLQPCYPAQVSDTSTKVPQTPRDLPLVTNQRIVSAHYGYGETVVKDKRFTLVYVIPIDVKEVRPKDMDKPYMELGVAPVRANDHYKSGQVDAQAEEEEFLAAVQSRSKADIGLVKKALEVIKWYHGPMNRHSGEPFYLHPVAVAQIVLDYNTEEGTVLGALLHDTVEDTPMLVENIETLFNKEVAEIVDGVTHLASNKATFYKVQLSSRENVRQLLEVKDQRVLYVKLADRLHNMRTIEGHRSLAKRQSIAEETMLFFVPLAEKLGLEGAGEELKERCFEVFSSK